LARALFCSVLFQDATIDAAAAFVKKIGKTGVHCGDTPGN
jgi:hypothetical protein